MKQIYAFTIVKGDKTFKIALEELNATKAMQIILNLDNNPCSKIKSIDMESYQLYEEMDAK